MISDDLEDLLENYWNCAYNEGRNKVIGDAGETLSQIRALFSAKQPCPECEERKTTALNYISLKLEFEQLQAERGELARQVAHWKANHASVVKQARILKERPDMPIERVKAYENWVAMAEQVEKMRAVLKEYSLKENDGMNGSFRVCCSTRPNEPHADCECTEALALPDISTRILNRVRAESLRKAADICNVHAMMATNKDGAEWANSCETAIRALAADMEAGKC